MWSQASMQSKALPDVYVPDPSASVVYGRQWHRSYSFANPGGCLVDEASLPSTCQMLAVNHKLAEDMSTRLMYARQDYVKAHQPKIQLGSKKGDFRYVK